MAQDLRCQQPCGQGVSGALCSTDLVWATWTPGSDSCSSVTSRCVAAGFLSRELGGIPILLNGNVVERLWEGVGTGVLQPGFVMRSGHVIGGVVAWTEPKQSVCQPWDFRLSSLPMIFTKKPQLSNFGTFYFSTLFLKSHLLQYS